MKDVPSLSPSEWQVAEIVWSYKNLTGSEIHARLPAECQWKPKTVNTFLTRLVKKGILSVKRDGRAFRYRSECDRDDCVQSECDQFLRRVFRGNPLGLIECFINRSDLTGPEARWLRKRLKKIADKA